MSQGDADPYDGLSVRGGLAGQEATVIAVIEDVEGAASQLLSAAQDLLAIQGPLAAALATSAPYLTALDSAPTFVRAEATSLAALTGPAGLGPIAGCLGAIGAHARTAALAYRTADAAADALARRVDVSIGQVVGGVTGGPAAAAVLGMAGVVAADHAPALAEHAFGAVPGGLSSVMPGTTSMAGAAAVVAAVSAGTPWLHEPGGRLQARVSTGPTPIAAPRGVRDIVARLRGLSPTAVADPAGTASAPGTVRVERVTAASGSRAWIALVPGTQTWQARPGPNPLDATGAVVSLAGGRTAGRDLVQEALTRAGARPGEQVLLAGHSQGGMVAANLAADPAFRARFTVTHVVTLGSPIGDVPIPPSVRVLSLEHESDVVPRLDGVANPARPTWTTVTAPAPTLPVPASAHSSLAYGVTAGEVDTSVDPSLSAWAAGLEPFLDGPGVRAEAIEVTGRRRQG